MDEVEMALCNALEGVAVSAHQSNAGTGDWTKLVKCALVNVGKSYASQKWVTGGNNCGSNTGHEWLFDVIWYEQDSDGKFLDLILAAESEWHGHDKIKEDFEKLLVARAKYRVMICEYDNISSILSEMRLWIDSFKCTQVGDRFLLAVWSYTEWHFEHIVV